MPDIPGEGAKIVTGRGGDTGGRNRTEVKKGRMRLKAEGKLVRDYKDCGGGFQVWLQPAAT